MKYYLNSTSRFFVNFEQYLNLQSQTLYYRMITKLDFVRKGDSYGKSSKKVNRKKTGIN